jgi:hypothetical protein
MRFSWDSGVEKDSVVEHAHAQVDHSVPVMALSSSEVMQAAAFARSANVSRFNGLNEWPGQKESMATVFRRDSF